nr:DDE-type integrase/transposase/recombinase [Massilia frigida]
MAWRISNSMDASFCVDCLVEALVDHGTPDIFNTDQGSQFTSLTFTGVLKRESVDISMDGRGRASDNIFVERPLEPLYDSENLSFCPLIHVRWDAGKVDR